MIEIDNVIIITNPAKSVVVLRSLQGGVFDAGKLSCWNRVSLVDKSERAGFLMWTEQTELLDNNHKSHCGHCVAVKLRE